MATPRTAKSELVAFWCPFLLCLNMTVTGVVDPARAEVDKRKGEEEEGATVWRTGAKVVLRGRDDLLCLPRLPRRFRNAILTHRPVIRRDA